jgi:NAD(P)-dependent dehydrogenase (short-subunit alcohol dehydrogenase family)
MGRLDGKVAVVTGASAGIGRAVFERFGAEGARLVGVGRNRANLDAAAEAARDAGGEAVIVTGDVSKMETAQRAVEAAVARFDGLDIVVNNAAVGWTYEMVKPGSMKPLADTPPELWREILGINLDSVYYMIHEAIPQMRKRGAGAIVNVASIGGVRGLWDAHTYTAAKGAIVNLTRSLALTYGRENIRTVCVAPGLTDTGMITNKLDELGRPFDHEATKYALSPMGRIGEPAEVANACLFLASDEASYVNGSVLLVDGGLHCGVSG